MSELSRWDKVRQAKAILQEYQNRKANLDDENVALCDSIQALEQTYRKLLNAAVEHELSNTGK